MHRSRLVLLFFVLALSPLMVLSDLTAGGVVAAAPAMPSTITSVTARPGPGVGQITLSWKSAGAHTTGFVLQTALTSFGRSSPNTAGTGRRARYSGFSAKRRSITLPASTVSSFGAGVASGNALFFRLYAVNRKGGRTASRAYGRIQTVLPRPPAPKARGTWLRVASFNVRTARATLDRRNWSKRAPDVARQILARRPGVVAIQELGPGRADGLKGSIKRTPRQTNSLLAALAKAGGQRYRLVRTTPYVAYGKPTATQGARLLYNSSRYALVTRCPEKTGKRSYSQACSFPLPLLRTDRETQRRHGALAEFRDKKTGKRFWVVSVHLDPRHSASPARERVLNSLRYRQASTAAAHVAYHNRARRPVLIAGDFNSWQNSRGGNSAHDRLVQLGYYDTSAALRRWNFRYTTFNAFRTTLRPSVTGVGVRLDMILVKGARGANRYENMMRVSDGNRSSDHNMIMSDIVL